MSWSIFEEEKKTFYQLREGFNMFPFPHCLWLSPLWAKVKMFSSSTLWHFWASEPFRSGRTQGSQNFRKLFPISGIRGHVMYINNAPKNAQNDYIQGKVLKVIYFDTFALFNLRKTCKILWNPWFLLSFPIRAKLVTEASLTTIL